MNYRSSSTATVKKILEGEQSNATDFDSDDVPTKKFVYPKLPGYMSFENARSLEKLSVSKSSKDFDEHMKVS